MTESYRCGMPSPHMGSKHCFSCICTEKHYGPHQSAWFPTAWGGRRYSITWGDGRMDVLDHRTNETIEVTPTNIDVLFK